MFDGEKPYDFIAHVANLGMPTAHEIKDEADDELNVKCNQGDQRPTIVGFGERTPLSQPAKRVENGYDNGYESYPAKEGVQMNESGIHGFTAFDKCRQNPLY